MSWEQMLSIVSEAIGYKERELVDPPIACPFDGEPLDPAPDGGLFCKLGNYRWPQQRRII